MLVSEFIKNVYLVQEGKYTSYNLKNLDCINILMSIFINCHLQNIVTMSEQCIQMMQFTPTVCRYGLTTVAILCLTAGPSFPVFYLNCSSVVYITKYCLHWWPDTSLCSCFQTLWKQKKWVTPHLLESNIFTDVFCFLYGNKG